MPAGRYKSRTFRRVSQRTPGGHTRVYYRKRKPAKAKCALCKQILKGVPRERPAGLKKLAKSSRRPERPYGGRLCSKCTKKLLIKQARMKQIALPTK